jgi:hypothetical protein
MTRYVLAVASCSSSTTRSPRTKRPACGDPHLQDQPGAAVGEFRAPLLAIHLGRNHRADPAQQAGRDRRTQLDHQLPHRPQQQRRDQHAGHQRADQGGDAAQHAQRRRQVLQHQQVHEIGACPAEERQHGEHDHDRHAAQSEPGQQAGAIAGVVAVAIVAEQAVQCVQVHQPGRGQQPVDDAERQQDAVQQRGEGQRGLQEFGHACDPWSALRGRSGDGAFGLMRLAMRSSTSCGRIGRDITSMETGGTRESGPLAALRWRARCAQAPVAGSGCAVSVDRRLRHAGLRLLQARACTQRIDLVFQPAQLVFALFQYVHEFCFPDLQGLRAQAFLVEVGLQRHDAFRGLARLHALARAHGVFGLSGECRDARAQVLRVLLADDARRLRGGDLGAHPMQGVIEVADVLVQLALDPVAEQRIGDSSDVLA